MSTFDDERRMQVLVDEYYKERGIIIDRSNSCKQYDLRMSQNGTSYLVEEKFNFTDRNYNQMIVELIQDAKTGDLGWFYHVKCDHLFWFYCPSDRRSRPNLLYVIDWLYFKDYVFERMEEWVYMHFNDKNYGLTLNIPINLTDILKEGIADRYDMKQPTLWDSGI
jgi:hypothetical protein